MSSREQLVLAEILTRLDGAPLGPLPRPEGLTVDRSRLLSLKPSAPKHISIYPLLGDFQRKGSTGESGLTVKIVLWVKGITGTPVDADLDPLWLWVQQQLMSDESLGGLARQIDPIQKVWGFAIHQAPFGDLDLHYLISFRHNTADPTRI